MNSENIANYWWGQAPSLSMEKVYSLQKPFKFPREKNYYWKLTECTTILQVCRVQNKELAVSNYSLGPVIHDHPM